MVFKTVKVYKCRNCGKEIKKKWGFVNFDEDSNFADAANRAMSVSNGCYAFFHSCNKLQVGYCELIKGEIENKELEKQESRLKAELKDVKEIAEEYLA